MSDKLHWEEKSNSYQIYFGDWFRGAVYEKSNGMWYWTFFDQETIVNTGLNPVSSEEEAKNQIISFISERT